MSIPCIVSDIDGTLADCEHRRHHVSGEKKDWPAFFANLHLDPPLPKIINVYHWILQGLRCEGVLFTGRNERHRAATEIWLNEHFVSFSRLDMRADGDFRADDVVKAEMLERLRADGYEPYLVLDDRHSVVKMWRARGLTCLQVAEGNF